MVRKFFTRRPKLSAATIAAGALSLSLVAGYATVASVGTVSSFSGAGASRAVSVLASGPSPSPVKPMAVRK